MTQSVPTDIANESHKPKLLYLASEDWAFSLHFLPLLETAISLGMDVSVAAKANTAFTQIESRGATFIPVHHRRGSRSIVDVFRSIWAFKALIRSQRPQIVHCINIRMAFLGVIAAVIAGYRGDLILAPTGLGHVWIADGWKERTARNIIRLLFRLIAHRPRTHFVFENTDDPREFGLAQATNSLFIVHGAGVSAQEFAHAPLPSDPGLEVAVIARMLVPKGIREAVFSVVYARSQGADVSLHLFGEPDPENPTSLTTEELEGFCANTGIHWHGFVSSPGEVYRQHHVAMLLSYREGLPKALVEAAAIGRPIITTNVPGCREVIEDGKEGFLVAPNDIATTADRILLLASNPQLRADLANAARKRFEDRFEVNRIKETFAAMYRKVLARPQSGVGHPRS